MSGASAAAPVARPRVSPWLIAPVVALAAFMEVLDISIANVSLPHIAGDLSASQDESSWVLTSYLVTNAVVMPVSGWISTVVGRKRFFMICTAGFALTSLLCGLAPSLGLLVLTRALQGAAGGGLQPSGQAILSDTFSPAQRGMAFALYGISVVFAPAIGPTLGGWITDNFSWRWVFLINVPVGAVLFFLIGLLIEDPPDLVQARRDALKHGISFDYVGFGLVALGLGCLQIVLDRGQEDDWFDSGFIVVLSITAATALIGMIVWELRREDPIVDLRLLGDRTFAASFFFMFMLGFMLLGSTFVIPAFVQELLGYTATDAGLVITPGGFAIMLLMPIVGQLVTRADLRVLIGLGFLICGLALLRMTAFDLATDYATIAWARVYQSLGLAFLFIPINAVAFSNLPRAKTNNASALINLARNFGGSVGIALGSTLLAQRAQYHHAILASHVNDANPFYRAQIGRLSQYFHHVVGTQDVGHAIAVVSLTLERQARLLSYLDAFVFYGWIFLALIPAVLLLKAAKPAAGAGAH